MKTQLKRISTFLILLMTVALFSCNEGDDTPGLGEVGVKMLAVTDNNKLTNSGRVQSTITFTEVKVGVTEIELEFLDEDGLPEGEDEIEFEGQFIVDLLNGTSNPDFGVAALADDFFEELEIGMEPILEGNHSIYVALEFTPKDAVEPVNVVYAYDDDLDFELEIETGFQINDNGINQLLLLFDLDRLLKGIDLNQAVADENGDIFINESSNSELASIIESNLDRILDAGEDSDDDGLFDDEDDYDDDEDSDKD